MISLIARRLIQLPFIVLAVYTITFVLAWLIPGNPLDNPDGRRPPPEVVEAMKKQYNLDDPFSFYFSYLGDATGISWLLGEAQEATHGHLAIRREPAPARLPAATLPRESLKATKNLV